MSQISDFFDKHEDYHELKFVIDESCVNIRVDIAIAAKNSSLSRSALKTLDHHLTINNKTVRSSHKTTLGDSIEFFWSPALECSFSAENIPLDILYQDKDLMVIDKPWGLVTHPAKGHESGTLANGILHYLQSHNMDYSFGEEGRVGIVHRLDKDTRGLLIIALNHESSRALSLAFQERKVTKIYKALVKGQAPEFGIIDKPIGRSIYDRKKMAVLKNGGRDARTDFKAIKYFKEHTLLACKLFTGRTHQIRVHLAHLGYPVVNDELYSRQKVPLPGMGLLAYHLSFIHPTTHQEMSFTLPEPPEFTKLTHDLG